MSSFSVTTKKGVPSSLLSWIHPFLVILIPALVYLLGLPGGFEFDDGINIVKNEHIRIASLDFESLKNAALSSNSGPLRRPVAMLSFAINSYFSQDSVVGYKVVNIGIHSFNALLVYFLSLLVLRRLPAYVQGTHGMAFAVAILWSLLPINLTSVLYVIQRMVSLGGTFALLAILAWFRVRLQIERDGRISLFWSGAVLLNFALAALCKENYILAYPAIVLLDWVLFTRKRAQEKLLMRIQAGGLVVVAVLVAVLLIVKPEVVVGDFSQRPFNMIERLLTQGRALIFYVGLMVFPSNLRLGLYHDDFTLSRGMFEPMTTALSVVLILSVTIWAFRNRTRHQLLFLGVTWFLCWHLLESTVVSLELVHEHRNYLASIGFVWVGLYCFSWLKTIFESKAALSVIVAMIFILNFAVTSLRAKEWSDLVEHALAEVGHHPHSVRAKYQLGRVHLMLYYENRDKKHLRYSYQAFEEAAHISQYDLLPWFGMIRVGLILRDDISPNATALAEKLQSDRIPASTIMALNDFQECVKAMECEGLQGYFIGFIDALIKNPTLDKKSLAQLYTLKASYYSEVEDNYDKSYEVLQQATKVLPLNYHLRKSLLYYYVITVKLDQAERELEYFKADFGERRDAAKVVVEVCDIFKERGYESHCNFIANLQDSGDENDR